MFSKKFQVIKIIDSKNLLINGGSEDGVRLHNIFNIYDKSKKNDVEGKNNHVFGIIYPIKAKLIVTNLYEHIAVCSMPNKPFNKIVSTFRYREDMNVNDNEISGGKITTNKAVKIGDMAQRIG